MTLKINNRSHDILVAQSAQKKDQPLQMERVALLRESIFPLSAPKKDKLGRTIQLWSLPQAQVMAVVKRSDGSVYQISPSSIRNGLDSSENNTTLHNRFLSESSGNFDFVVENENKLSIWPHLEAGGWKDALPKPNGDMPGLTRLAQGRTQEQMCAWFYKNGYTVGVVKKEPVVVLHLNGHHAADLKATDHKAIKNMLDQKAVIVEVKFKEFSKEERNVDFAGRGLVFSHPKDRTSSRFNVDYSRFGIKEYGSKGRPEHQGGYHIDVKSQHFPKEKKQISTHETYLANRAASAANKTSQKIHNTSTAPFKLLACNSILKQFVQQTGLAKSYNSTHPQNPIPTKAGASGDIGGVACSAEYMQGLFSKPEDLFIQEHFFFLPNIEGVVPFSNDQLRQILREVAIGVYEHSAIPFFSLHFNQDTNLVPLIHPAYQNTLVGRVIGMLDYIMKGYLNGGVFKEDFIDQWAKNPKWNHDATAFDQMIDFVEYCEKELSGQDKEYTSVQHHQVAAQHLNDLFGKLGGISLSDESSVLKDFTEFSNSFRILSNLESFEKEGPLLAINAGFSVEYTIAPTEKYKQHFSHHLRTVEGVPPSYAQLQSVFELFKGKIHDHLTKFPLCKPYFSMLQVISYISAYYSTLKRHHKVPVFSQIVPSDVRGCPSLFPHLPLKTLRSVPIKINFADVVARCDELFIKNYLSGLNQDTTLIYEEALRTVLNSCDFSTRKELEKRIKNKNVVGLKVELELKNIIFFQLNKLKLKFGKFCYKQHYQTQLDSILEMKRNCEQRIFDHYNFKKIMDRLQTAMRAFLKDIGNQTSDEVVKCVTEMIAFGYGTAHGHVDYLHELRIALADLSNQTLDLRPFYEAFKKSNSNKLPIQNVLLPVTDVVLEMTVHPMDQTPSEKMTAKKMVGGCSIRLNRQEVESTARVQNLLSHLMPVMTNMAEETWQLIADETNLETSGALFKLALESSPSSDYSWMEKAFFLRGDMEAELGYLPIHFAAKEGSLETLKSLTSATLVNAKTKNGATPLIIAAMYGHLEAVAFLISKGAANSYLTTGYHALHCALHQGHTAIARLFLETSFCNSAEMNACAEEGGTPLFLACQIGDLALVQALVKAGASPALLNKRGLSALDIALKLKNGPLVAYLLTISPPSDHAIEFALKRSSSELVALIAKSSNFPTFVNAFQDTPLMIAIRHGNLDAARFLLQDKSRINAVNSAGESALDLAVQNGFYEFIPEILAAGGQNIALPHLTTLIRFGFHESLKSLVESVPLTPKELNDLAQIAAETGNFLPLSTILVPKGAELNKIQGPNGWTVSHYLAKFDGLYLFKKITPLVTDFETLALIAAENGSVRVLRHLLEAKKQPVIASSELLGKAVISGNIESVELILSKDLLLLNKPVDHDKKTVLHLAAEHGHQELFEWLIQKGAPLDLLDNNEATPLVYALKVGSEEMVSILLERKIKIYPCDLYAAARGEKAKLLVQVGSKASSIDCTNHKMQTALMLATQEKDEKAAIKLLKLGANPHYQSTPNSSWSPLLLASSLGLIKVIQAIKPAHLLSNIKNENKNSLEHACQNGHTSIAAILSSAGYKTALNFKNSAIAQTLGSFYPHAGTQEKLFLALRTRSLKDAVICIGNLPYNERLSFFKGSLISATPLQLALHMGLKLPIEDIKKWVDLGLNPNLADSEGNTLAHLMAKLDLNPELIPGLSFDKVNHKKQTPLHLAAKFCDQEAFASYLNRSLKQIDSEDRLGRTPLFYALKKQKHENCELLAKFKANVNHKNFALETPLYRAVRMNNFKGVKILCSYGANVNQSATLKRHYPLHTSINSSEQNELFLYLMSQGAKTDDSKGLSATHYASEAGNLEVLRLSVAQGASLRSAHHFGIQPIHIAAKQGHEDILDELISANGISVDTPITGFEKTIKLEGETPLLAAVRHGNADTVQYLINHNGSLTLRDENINLLTAASNYPAVVEVLKKYTLTQNLDELHKAMRQACYHDNPTTLLMLLACGSSVDRTILDRNTLLHIASIHGALQCTELLIELGANCFVEGENKKTPLELAVANSNEAQFRHLLEACLSDPTFSVDQANAKGETLVHLAVKSGNLAHLVHLVNYDAALDLQDHQGRTPLALACKKNQIPILKFLLSCGVNPNGVELPEDLRKILSAFELSDTPLHKALWFNEPYSIHLFSHLLDVNIPNKNGTRPLHIAVLTGIEKNILHLIKEGADVNAVDRYGRTPLEISCHLKPSLPTAKLLLSCGADPFWKNHQGDTLVKQIKMANLPEMASFLKLLAEYESKRKRGAAHD